MLSDSPPEKDINWSESGINGAWKICQKIWSLVNSNKKLLIIEEKNDEYSEKGLNLLKFFIKTFTQSHSLENFR